VALLCGACCALQACGGGGGASSPVAPLNPSSPPPAPASASIRVSGLSPFPANCAPSNGETLYLNSEVEPYLVVSPTNARVTVGVWQQDRWSGGGARGILVARSVDGGSTWSMPIPPALSDCMGGAPGSVGYQRASDPWLAYSSDGATLYQSALALTTGTSSAVLVSASSDDGQTWSVPTAVVRDAPDIVFNDKESISADPLAPNIAYVTWDRSTADVPAMLARTTDRAVSWQPMQLLFDPGSGYATIGNVIVGLNGGGPLGTLIDCFTQYPVSGVANLRAIRSTNQGQTWPANTATTIAALNSVQTRDPFTGLPVRDGSILGTFAADPRPGSTTLYAAWEDATPVANQDHNAIVLSRSGDGGATWSTPLLVNGDPTVPAFNPSIAVRSDGEIGLRYYDFRGALAGAAIPVSVWLARSSDGGSTWVESQIDGPFDLTNAPIVQGQLFLGDYEGFTGANTEFLSFYAKVVSGSTGPTDIFFDPANVPFGMAAHAAQARRYAAAPLAGRTASTRLKQEAAENLRRSLMHRFGRDATRENRTATHPSGATAPRARAR